MKPTMKWLAASAAAIAVCATAALGGTVHHMTINLPGGGTEQIDYSGDVAPNVRFLTPQMVRDQEDASVWAPFAQMQAVSAMMDRMAADLDRQMQVSLQRVQQVQQLAMGMTDAALQSLPAGTESYSVTTISPGHSVCTKSVRITSNGDGEKPQMVSQSAGCGDDAASWTADAKTTAIRSAPRDQPAARQHI